MRRSQLAQALALPLGLEEGRPPRLASHVSLLGLFAVIGFVAWSAVAEVTERAVADGQVMPAGRVQAVQHLEGGIVSEILVEEGQVVAAGQPLLRLSPSGTVADREQLRTREMALALRAERLRAFAEGRMPDFSFGAAYPDLVADQETIFRTQSSARGEQIEVLERRAQQRRAERDSFASQENALRRQVAILTEQLEMRQTLLEKGLVSRVVFLETERAVSQAHAQLSSLLGEMSRAGEAVGEAERQIVETRTSLANDAFEEMGRTTAELAEVREQLAKMDDRVDRLEIAAPTDGIVQGLTVSTLGGVVGPGEVMLQLVPVDDEMVAEVQLDPRDIGHVKVGDTAVVKVSTYDPMRFGTIAGTVSHLSPSTFTAEDGRPFYKGVIALASNAVGRDGVQHLILPGMVVSADIVTGQKTLLEYLVKPVYRALNEAFGER
jgi:HlyD family secretion protein/adhesin transport system membrane fusion protein